MSRYLGQHFLINKAAVKKIIAVLDSQTKETIIEIGPGKGALTLPLAEECKKLGCEIVAIEKDPALVEKLKNLEIEKLEIIEGDALKKLPELTTRYTLPATPYKIVGNIPYYITGKLLRIISKLDPKPKLTVLTIQREVAERITAKPGKMNLLAAAVQIWAGTEIIGYLKPSDFSPPPKIESAIIKLVTRERQLVNGDLENYYKLVKILFKQPRKTLLNNLSTGLKLSKKDGLKQLNLIGMENKSRPQDLSISQIIDLSRLVNKFL